MVPLKKHGSNVWDVPTVQTKLQHFVCVVPMVHPKRKLNVWDARTVSAEIETNVEKTSVQTVPTKPFYNAYPGVRMPVKPTQTSVYNPYVLMHH
tara:strand:- start:593 stop:874 length:282 start_codon:yes stop_codon:yes gene_type:complete